MKEIHWDYNVIIDDGVLKELYSCSNCGMTFNSDICFTYSYCPNCGLPISNMYKCDEYKNKKHKAR